MTYMTSIMREMSREHFHEVAQQKEAHAISETLSSDNALFVSAWADYDQDDVVTLWEATCLSVGVNPKHKAVRHEDFAKKIVALGAAADDYIKKLNEVLRRYKNVSTHAKNPNSGLKTADELRKKIELSAFRKWVEAEKDWELPGGFPGASASTTTPSPAPEPQAAPVVEAPASEPKAKRTTAFNGVLPYLQTVHRNGKFKTTGEFIRELGRQSGEVDSPFKKAARTDVTFYLKSGGQSVSHSLIADRMKSIR